MTINIDQKNISNVDIGKPEYWTYKSEGAMNVVLAYTGPFNEDLNGLVLRVKKQSNGGSNLEKEIELFKFVSKVMSPLLGEQYVFPGSMINISEDFLEKLDSLIYRQRPASRSIVRLDTKLTVAFLIMDLTKLTNFNIDIDHNRIQRSPLPHQPKQDSDDEKVICIEIKPKWGFLPNETLSTKFMSNETRDIKSNSCRYCMHQYLKFKENSIGYISKYCPIDLFHSDNEERQKHSIKELIAQPQNNLKVYYNGKLSFTGSLGGGMERDNLSNCQLLSNILFENKIIQFINDNGCEKCINNNINNSSSNNNKNINEGEGIDKININKTIDTFSTIVVKILERESILQNIKKVQLFDKYDIEGIYYLYNKLNNNEIDNQSLNIPLDSKEELNKLSINQIKEIIDQFMISCTAKDCSIMISFKINKLINSINQLNNLLFINESSTTNNNNQNNNNNTTVLYKIGIVDLDSKKQSAIPKYYKLDKEIVENYKSSVNSIKSCK